MNEANRYLYITQSHHNYVKFYTRTKHTENTNAWKKVLPILASWIKNSMIARTCRSILSKMDYCTPKAWVSGIIKVGMGGRSQCWIHLNTGGETFHAVTCKAWT